ncbi:hypothetical protein EMMF5_006018, partial [Cystobasidiomycetes sp. EMM_F5]
MTATYKDVALNTNIGSFNIHYVEAGDTSKPTLLLLHGFPSSSTQFRNLIPLLSDAYHILAPDLPGFGLTTYPTDMAFTFDNLAAAISAYLDALRISSFSMYIFDYGAPTGLRVALQRPQAVKAIISQNGNAYEAGFGKDFWKLIFDLWESGNAQKERDTVRDNVLTLNTTRYQYEAGVPPSDIPLIDPALTYYSDYNANIAGRDNQERQLDLFYDYRTNPKELYPKVHEYLKKSQ